MDELFFCSLHSQCKRLISEKWIVFLSLFSFITTSLNCATPKPYTPTLSFKEIPQEIMDIDRTPMQGDYPNANAVFLIDEGDFSVTKTEYFIFTRHVIIKILNEAGLKYANVEIPFYADEEVHNIKARTIRKDGTTVDLQPEDIHDKSLFPKFVLYSDSKAKVFAMPGAEVGSVIEYSYAVLQNNPYASAWEFQREEPIVFSKLTLNVPQLIRYNYMLVQAKGVEIEKSISNQEGRNKVVFQAKDIPALKQEPFMPPLSEITTKVYFSAASLVLPSGLSRPIEGNSWEILGDKYWFKVKDLIKADEAIKSEVKEITKELSTEIDKIIALYNFVQSEIRYVAIEIKEGRVVPHRPSEVFNNKYGDCKDKAFLLLTMLNEVGIEAFPALVRTSSSGKVVESFKSYQQFDHMVIMLPARYFADVEEYDKNNKNIIKGDKPSTASDDYVLLDVTSPAIPFAEIPWYLEDTKALLIKENGSELISIPSSPAQENKTLRVCEVSIRDDGTLICSIKSTKTGHEASTTRSFLQTFTHAEQKEWFEYILLLMCPGAVLEEYSIVKLFEPASPLELNYKFYIPSYSQKTDNVLTFNLNFLRDLMVDILTRKDREHSVIFDYRTISVDVFNINIPGGYELKNIPNNLSKSTYFGDYSLSCLFNGEIIVSNRQFSINNKVIKNTDYKLVKSFFEYISMADRKEVILIYR